MSSFSLYSGSGKHKATCKLCYHDRTTTHENNGLKKTHSVKRVFFRDLNSICKKIHDRENFYVDYFYCFRPFFVYFGYLPSSVVTAFRPFAKNTCSRKFWLAIREQQMCAKYTRSTVSENQYPAAEKIISELTLPKRD